MSYDKTAHHAAQAHTYRLSGMQLCSTGKGLASRERVVSVASFMAGAKYAGLQQAEAGTAAARIATLEMRIAAISEAWRKAGGMVVSSIDRDAINETVVTAMAEVESAGHWMTVEELAAAELAAQDINTMEHGNA